MCAGCPTELPAWLKPSPASPATRKRKISQPSAVEPMHLKLTAPPLLAKVSITPQHPLALLQPQPAGLTSAPADEIPQDQSALKMLSPAPVIPSHPCVWGVSEQPANPLLHDKRSTASGYGDEPVGEILPGIMASCVNIQQQQQQQQQPASNLCSCGSTAACKCNSSLQESSCTVPHQQQQLGSRHQCGRMAATSSMSPTMDAPAIPLEHNRRGSWSHSASLTADKDTSSKLDSSLLFQQSRPSQSKLTGANKRVRRNLWQGVPKALKCGHCKHCQRPSLKKACITRRQEQAALRSHDDC